jgi:hypothetical protein
MRYILEYNEYEFEEFDKFDNDCYSIENEFLMNFVDEYPDYDIKYKFVRQKADKGASHWEERKNIVRIIFNIKLEKIMDDTIEQDPEIYTKIYSSIDKINLTDKFKNAFKKFIDRITNHFRKQIDEEDEKFSDIVSSMTDTFNKTKNISDEDIQKFLSLRLKNPDEKMECRYSIDVKRNNNVEFITTFMWD